MNIHQLTEFESATIPDMIKDLVSNISKIDDPYYTRCKIILEFLQNSMKQVSVSPAHEKSKRMKKIYAYRTPN